MKSILGKEERGPKLAEDALTVQPSSFVALESVENVRDEVVWTPKGRGKWL